MIRYYEVKDLPSLLEIHRTILDTISLPAYFNWSAEAFTDELSKAKTIVYIDIQKQLLGFISFRKNSDAFEISVLGTRRTSQGKGVMTELIQYLQSYAAEQNKVIWLEVHEKNHGALRTYTKNAFELGYKRKNYYSDGASACVLTWKSPPHIK